MNPEIKEKWLTSLRSGEFLQGRGCLRATDDLDGKDYYCSLGILCNLLVGEERSWHHRGTVWGFEDSTTTISNTTREFLGITDFQVEQLVVLNDSYQKSFSEIANYIERNL